MAVKLNKIIFVVNVTFLVVWVLIFMNDLQATTMSDAVIFKNIDRGFPEGLELSGVYLFVGLTIIALFLAGMNYLKKISIALVISNFFISMIILTLFWEYVYEYFVIQPEWFNGGVALDISYALLSVFISVISAVTILILSVCSKKNSKL